MPVYGKEDVDWAAYLARGVFCCGYSWWGLLCDQFKIIFDAAFAVVVSLIDILVSSFLLLIWL